MSAQNSVLTVGHSNHSVERFLELLGQHGVTALCDVRSKPYSRMYPQFNRGDLEQDLVLQGIRYLFLGTELGARSEDPACYEGGRVRYDRIAGTDAFQKGLARILRGIQANFRIALLCAEKEPLDCHRSILVARYLSDLDCRVEHIHADGHLESHEAAMSRLARKLKLPEDHLFYSHEELLADAYRRQEERIAYELAESPDSAMVAAGAA